MSSYKRFEQNYGQVGDFNGSPVNDVLFFSRDNNLGIFIKKGGASFVIYKFEENSEGIENSLLHFARVDIEILDSDIKELTVIYEDELQGYQTITCHNALMVFFIGRVSRRFELRRFILELTGYGSMMMVFCIMSLRLRLWLILKK